MPFIKLSEPRSTAINLMPTNLPPPIIEPSERPTSRFAGWMLGRPLTLILTTIGVLQLLAWVPHYLTWPYWADHDVFVTGGSLLVRWKTPLS